MEKRVRIVIMLVAGCAVIYSGTAFAVSNQVKAALEADKEEMRQRRDEAVVSRDTPMYTAVQFRDPFLSLITQQKDKSPTVAKEIEVKPPDLTVQGVMWGGKIPQAIIDNQVVKAGDTIKEAYIKSISRSGITFSYMERDFTISSPAMAGSDKKAQP